MTSCDHILKKKKRDINKNLERVEEKKNRKEKGSKEEEKKRMRGQASHKIIIFRFKIIT